MKRLHKFIISAFLGPFILTFFIVIFLLLMQFLWKYIDDLAGKGLEFSVIGELMFYAATSMVPMAFPLAVLMASLMTLGNLGENFELIALKASGISLPRIVAPLVVFCLILSLFAFLFANYLLPITNLKMTTLIVDIGNKKPELNIKEGVFFNGIAGYSIRIGKKNYKTNLLHQLRIYDHTKGQGNNYVTVADSGYIKMTTDKRFLILTLFSGYNYNEIVDNQRPTYSKQTYPDRKDHFQRQEIRIKLEGFDLNRSDESMFKQSYKMLSIRQLRKMSDTIQLDIDQKVTALNKLILNYQLFRYKPAFANKKVPLDTLRYHISHDTLKLKPCKDLNIDSVLDRLTFYEQNSMNAEALNYAREVKTYIFSNNINNDGAAKRKIRYDIEWWRKFTLSAACFVFFFIGAPLGAIIRKGGLGMPVVISVLFFVLYYIISITFEKFAREGVFTPLWGMWFSTLILFPIGIFLTRKATKDSSMLNIETYLNPLKKIFNFFIKKQK